MRARQWRVGVKGTWEERERERGRDNGKKSEKKKRVEEECEK
jgi:hypothetical protein